MKKHFKLLTAALLMGSISFFASCGDDDDDEVNVSAPTITFEEGGDPVTLEEGAAHTIKIKAEQPGASGDLSNFTVIATVDGTAETKIDSTLEKGKKSFTYEATITKGSAATESWTFTIKNTAGKNASKSVTLTLGTKTPFTYENTEDGALWHLFGTGNGAFNLAENKGELMSGSDTNKDMVNTSTESGSPFAHGWMSHADNGTMYVEVTNSVDYSNITVEEAKAAYEAGTPNGTVQDVEASDVFVAKLRNTNEYCVIFIEEVSDTDKTSGEGHIFFNYKKTSQTAGQ